MLNYFLLRLVGPKMGELKVSIRIKIPTTLACITGISLITEHTTQMQSASLCGKESVITGGRV